MKRRVPGTTVVRSTHARSTPPTAAMQSTLNSLLTTHESITTSLSTLRTAASIHATRSSAVADRLAAARGSLDTAKDTGKMVRLKQRFLSELDNAKSLLGGGETALRRVIAILEGVAGATINPSHPALSELAEASTALADALDREWRAWLGSSSGAELLWQGARSLALAPPGGLSDGLDNLGRQRSSLELARSLWETAERIDKLLSRLPEESGDSGEPTNVASCHALLQKECAQRCTADLQTANRLAAHATTIGTDDADGSSVLLEAVAEAASAAAKAARAASAVFTLLPPPEEVEDSKASSSLQEMSTATDGLLTKLKSLPEAGEGGGSSGTRGKELKTLGSETSALLRRQLDAAANLASAAQHAKGRRALSMLGEAGEKLAAAALAQARAERAAALC